MRRTQIAAILSLSLLFLVGCRGQEAPAEMPSSPQADSPQPEPVSTAPDNTSSEMNDAIERYRTLYRAEHVYRDMVVPQKALLIGETQIVELTCFSGYEQTKVIERTAVVRVETNRLDAFTVVNIYDKTNQCISVMVASGASEEILRLLN